MSGPQSGSVGDRQNLKKKKTMKKHFCEKNIIVRFFVFFFEIADFFWSAGPVAPKPVRPLSRWARPNEKIGNCEKLTKTKKSKNHCFFSSDFVFIFFKCRRHFRSEVVTFLNCCKSISRKLFSKIFLSGILLELCCYEPSEYCCSKLPGKNVTGRGKFRAVSGCWRSQVCAATHMLRQRTITFFVVGTRAQQTIFGCVELTIFHTVFGRFRHLRHLGGSIYTCQKNV